MQRVVPIDPSNPPASRLEAALEPLEAGAVVALPTETFYGLAADAANCEALAQLNRLKGKPDDSPILLLLADTLQAQQVSAQLPPLFGALAEMFWPGPLTLVVPASDELPPEIYGSRRTVGVRVPGLALPRRLAARLGRPITGVSANLHGQPPCRTALQVAAAFPDGVALILDGGPTTGGAPSTILDLSGHRPRILRQGQVPVSALRPFVPDL